MLSLSRKTLRFRPHRMLVFAALVLLVLCAVAAACADVSTPTDLGPVSYDYDAGLYDPDSGNYPGVYSVAIKPTEGSEVPTIGMPSIADDNLDAPTTESPAIIQGAAVGYEIKTGPTDYTVLKERPDPYDEYRYSIMEETAADGSVHKKLSGFDGTYVITRLDVSAFFDSSSDLSALYLHMRQDGNRALIPGMGMTDGGKGFADQLGSKAGAYLLADLIDKSDGNPYIDILVFATASIVPGADAGKEGALTGDIDLQLYVDEIADYNPGLTYDPMSTDPDHQKKMLEKFFDPTKIPEGGLSRYVIKGSDLALETAVEHSSGPDKHGEETTYWSLKKSMEDPYYDLEEDSSPDDPGSGRTVKLISEVAVTDGLSLTGTDEQHLRKRTLDLSSFDIQLASNTAGEQSSYSVAILLEYAWLTIKDTSNTTGAEMAIGNNARFVIDKGGKLIVDESCQLEIEWDGATTTPGAETPTTPDVLNNGLLDLRAGGEIINYGIITIEGFEGKPYQPEAKEQAVSSEKGCGILTICEGATLTNYGAMMIYGQLYNLGTLVNYGKYDDLIVSNDPDKGQFAYHKGIQISWKDDVTQQGVEAGSLINGKDQYGNTSATATIINYGDIVLVPGLIQNYGEVLNSDIGRIFQAAAFDAVIPVEAPATTAETTAPVVVYKRVTLDPPKTSSFENYGTVINDGIITAASIPVNDDTSLGSITTLGRNPELFSFLNFGTVTNRGFIYGWGPLPMQAEDGTFLYLFGDGTFTIAFADGALLTGTFAIEGEQLVFTVSDGTVEFTADADGNGTYSFTAASGLTAQFFLTREAVIAVRDALEGEPGTDPIAQIRAAL